MKPIPNIEESWLIYMWGNCHYSGKAMATLLGIDYFTMCMRLDRLKKKGKIPYNRGYINQTKQ